MDLIDLLGTISELSQYSENTCDEVKKLQKSIKIISQYLEQNDKEILKQIKEQHSDFHDDIIECIDQTKQLIIEANKSQKQSGLIQKFKALLPGNILSKLKEQDEKLSKNYLQFKELYEQINANRARLNLPPIRPPPSDIPQTILEPENEIGGTIMDPDDEDEAETDQVTVRFEFLGDDEVKRLFIAKNLNTTEMVQTKFQENEDKQEKLFTFGRSNYISLMEDLKLIGLISSTHGVIHATRERIEQQEEEEEEKDEDQQNNNNNLKDEDSQLKQSRKLSQQQQSNGNVLQIPVPQKEDIFATVCEDVIYSQSNKKKQFDPYPKELYKVFLENQGGNGTFVYKQFASDGIRENCWEKVKTKGQRVQIQNGDKIAFLVNKQKPSETILGYTVYIDY